LELGAFSFTGPLAHARVETSPAGARIVALGVTRIEDEDGPLVVLAAPGLIELTMTGERWELHSDRFFDLRRPFTTTTIAGALLDESSIDVSGEIEDGPDGLLRVSSALHDRFAREQERTLARFELLPAP
ncbi:MAG: hypothetical protein KC457_29925, partial [Myxococcales bacterium]|nr:hypothetical protein [Myxococcales bacterium]